MIYDMIYMIYDVFRGLNYVSEHLHHKEWSKQLEKIKQIFRHCRWIDLIEDDLQGFFFYLSIYLSIHSSIYLSIHLFIYPFIYLSTYLYNYFFELGKNMIEFKTVDHFCQTWSLIIVIYVDKYLKFQSTIKNHHLFRIDNNNDDDDNDDDDDISCKENITYNHYHQLDNIHHHHHHHHHHFHDENKQHSESRFTCCNDYTYSKTTAATTSIAASSTSLLLSSSTQSSTSLSTTTTLSSILTQKIIIELKDNIKRIMNGYHEIIKFWKEINHNSKFKQYIYYEIYRQTHNYNGKRIYNRYFTTLESLVNYNNYIYYPYSISYDDTSYTFIEDFLDSINDDMLYKILS